MNWNLTDLHQINLFCKNTLVEYLAISFTEITDTTISARMPVDHRTHQPMGLLHGGASVALIETIGSMGSALLCDKENYSPVGIEVNANHLGSVKSGFVIGVGKPIHIGKSTHVWQVDIHDEITKKHISSGRISILIKKNRN